MNTFEKKLLAVFIGLIITMIALWKYSRNEINRIDRVVASQVGRKLVLDKDTLTIIDYSLLETNYTLSNGKKVGFDYVENKLNNKKAK